MLTPYEKNQGHTVGANSSLARSIFDRSWFRFNSFKMGSIDCKLTGFRVLKKISIVFLSLFCIYFFLSAVGIYIKANAAQLLIADAWHSSLKTGERIKPWPWADTWPVARLKSEYLTRDTFILAGAQGASLAFGPGHMYGTALPGEGASVVGGHRDTHFRFLKHVKPGDNLWLQNKNSDWLKFEIVSTRIDDIRQGYLGVDNRGDFLTLVTCYPFDAVNPGGPLRYVVTAQQVDDEIGFRASTNIPLALEF